MLAIYVEASLWLNAIAIENYTITLLVVRSINYIFLILIYSFHLIYWFNVLFLVFFLCCLFFFFFSDKKNYKWFLFSQRAVRIFNLSVNAIRQKKNTFSTKYITSSAWQYNFNQYLSMNHTIHDNVNSSTLISGKVLMWQNNKTVE